MNAISGTELESEASFNPKSKANRTYRQFSGLIEFPP